MIDELVVARLVKAVVEAKLLIVDVLRQVHFDFGQVNDDHLLVLDGQHVDVFLAQLLLRDRPFAHAHANLQILLDVVHRQELHVELLPVLADHRLKFPRRDRLVDFGEFLTAFVLSGASLLAIGGDAFDLFDHLGLVRVDARRWNQSHRLFRRRHVVVDLRR